MGRRDKVLQVAVRDDVRLSKYCAAFAEPE